MAIVVQKYGGTSVGTIEKIKNVARRVAKSKENGDDVVVVVSAMGKTTDILLGMASEISSNPDRRELDMLMSSGEQVSIALLSIALKELGYDSISLTGPQAGILTKGFHTKARITDIEIKNVEGYINDGKIVVVAGFQGVDEEGNITTLGRGGSDTTAVALAAKLGAVCEIYTDVDGIYTVDPRLFPTAKKLDYISYEEMVEMASLGSGVMETRSIEIAQRFNVPIYVALSSEEWPGTYIKEFDESMESKVITGLSVSDEDMMITINHVPYEVRNISSIFEKLASNDINIDMISQTAPSHGHINISFTAPKNDRFIIDKVMESIKNNIEGIEIDVQKDITKLSVVGIGMKSQSGVAAKMFKIFADNEIEFKQVTTSEIRISYTINTHDKEKAVVAVAKEFNL
ncbi:aspartate kinase [Paramaledivibacter caminithermalis]|uniref:Aspartokinase n=1 Tax=Paramaledivibacter caminithermalis (strain DSM 15212 / CIP 107654 / DViRD3) TaxID=1121301 RepID=A0A1M6QMF2_PARC5|nr:aspartate kinase [Paramaledivibacter caminithermalis]SHK21253.1 aspartate kinase [Paramaledivibacter caminithermalis DSM 15212]